MSSSATLMFRPRCHHEAGHALARWSFGHRQDSVTILSVDELLAGVRIEDRAGQQLLCEGHVDAYDICGWPYDPMRVAGDARAQERSDRLRGIARDIALIDCVSGIIAEARFRKVAVATCTLAGGDADMQHASMLLDAWNLHGVERRAASVLAAWRATTLIRSRPGEAAIRTIADALLERGRLTGTETADLCRRAYGGCATQLPHRAAGYRRLTQCATLTMAGPRTIGCSGA
ncbi:hypothetical protein [Methylobacterium sp. R2-1]|uniref:hypothetical protein n=1 Tax=Methylobacterium sp. R2-1 TaxID=2587064 RepID=UPI00161021C5|nr:hypothetical protein [Methylobacterium sp. R2-1]MBB2963343.1 hypothetical protein [Methylobacterium sp. R2-1]